jgi:nucleotide-binding universal stress UspA family protein
MNLLVALDSGSDGKELLTSARVLAHASGWPLRGLHVKLTADAPDLKLPARLTTNTEVREAVGDPVEEILKAAAEDDVIAFTMRRGVKPITSLRRIVVPLEGSPSSSEAMRLTDEVFCRPGREIVVVHVSTADTPDEPGSLPAPRMVDQEQYEWSSWHEEFTMRFATCPEGGKHRTVVRVGDPLKVIISEAKRLPADLIVLAWGGVFTKGHSAVVRGILEDAPCPLLLVPVPGHA